MFLINRGELSNRFDVEYYSLLKSYHFKFNYQLVKIGTLFFVRDGDHSKFPEDEKSSKIKGIRYLRAQDIKLGEIISEKPVFVSERYYKTIKRSHIRPNYILFSIMASIGSIAVCPEWLKKSTGNRAVGILVPKKISDINPHYIVALFNTNMGINLLELLKKGGVQQRINLEDLANLKIPVPHISRQNKIAIYLQQSFSKNKQKLADAQTLLDSIDDYLLTELGIKRPEAVVNTLENRIFTRNFSEISGGRFDAFYYQNTFNQNINSVLNASYPAEPLKNIIKDYLIKGKLPKEEEKGGKLKVIQINSIKKDGNINTNKLLTSENIFYKEQKLINNDVLIVITGATIGKIAFWNIEGDFYLGGDLVKFQTKKNINPYFIYSYLRFTASQIEIKRNITGATNGHLSPDDIKQILIPLPPIEKQTEIANHIQTLRERAKHLQQAETELQQAKNQVEKMILGEDNELSN